MQRGRHGPPHTPYVEGRLVRQAIERTNSCQQAGERYRAIEAWAREDLIANLVDAFGQCRREIQNRMVDHFTRCDPEYGARVAQGIGPEVKLLVAEPIGRDERRRRGRMASRTTALYLSER
jgi:catalase